MKRLLSTLFLGAALCAPLATPVFAEETAEATEVAPVEEAIVLQTPMLVTDAGQGNNATLVAVMLRRAQGIGYESKPLATVADLDGMKTLVIGVGASTKGLGAAGLDGNQEMERIKALVEAAQEKEITIVGIHIGGMPRRGELSDGFNEYVYRQSKVFLLYSGGNEDGFFTRLHEEVGNRLVTVERKPDIGVELIKMIASEKVEE